MFFKSKKSVTEQEVLQALSDVYDPDLNKNIVALGFVKKLKIEEGKVSFALELTTPACPVKDELKKQSEEKVKAIPGVESVEIEMTSNVRTTTQSAGNRIQLPSVKNVIAIASGKGGVGKSTVTVNIAMALAETGAKVGILDADIYGPSLPMMMGVKGRPGMEGQRVQPPVQNGIKLMSMGFLVEESQAVVWRGPMVHGALTQFMNQVDWGDLDYLLIDMPPGTGDAQLTISQTAPLSGAIIVTTPQEVSLLDARRGLLMFQNVKVPVLGVIENMAGFICDHCHEVTHIFREGGGEKFAREMNVRFLGSIPIDAHFAKTGDEGVPLVQSYPESKAAAAFKTIAGSVAATLSVLQAHSSAGFKPITMEWQNA